jgi:ABC-type sugar transport system ATPase subunit
MLQPQDKFFRGRPVSHFGGKLPIAFIHQDLGLIEWMTVAENLAFGLGFPRRGGLIQWKDVSRQADGLRARGIGMLYVSHRLDEIFRLTDRTAVMRDRSLGGSLSDPANYTSGTDHINRRAQNRRDLSARTAAGYK